MSDTVDITDIRAKYVLLEMPGMVALIDTLEEMRSRGREPAEIGSGTIVPPGWKEKPNMTEGEIFHAVFYEFKSLYFGGEGRTPLEDIASSVERLQKAPAELRQWVDKIVAEFARITKKISEETFEEVDPLTVDDDISLLRFGIPSEKLN